jgi:alpha-glucosidase
MYLGDEFKVSDSDKDKDILIGEKRIQVKAIEISK